jgi:hypothetical protein
MWQMKRWWHFLLQEPFIWLFYCLFQPAKFKRDFEAEDLLNRFIVMLRLALPMFLCSFMITLVTRIVLNFAYPGFYFYPLATGIPRFVYDTAWSTAFGVVGGMVGVIIISTTSNIALSFAVSVVTGSIVNIGTTLEVGAQALIVSGIIYGITCGLLFGLTVGSNQRTGMSNVISNIVGGIVGSIVGVVIGLFFGFLAGLFVGFVGSKTFIGIWQRFEQNWAI